MGARTGKKGVFRGALLLRIRFRAESRVAFPRGLLGEHDANGAKVVERTRSTRRGVHSKGLPNRYGASKGGGPPHPLKPAHDGLSFLLSEREDVWLA